jgi:hypothetical protein
VNIFHIEVSVEKGIVPVIPICRLPNPLRLTTFVAKDSSGFHEILRFASLQVGCSE